MSSPPNEPEPNERDPALWLDLFGEALFAQAYYFTKKPEDAEDAVQETLTRGIRAIEKFEGRSSVKTWLSAILRNVLLERYRKETRSPVTNLENAEALQDEGDVEAPLGLNPMKDIDRAEFWEAMSYCLTKIPEQAARVFWMKEIEGATTAELEEQLGLSKANIWVTIHRARKGLRACLAERFGSSFIILF